MKKNFDYNKAINEAQSHLRSLRNKKPKDFGNWLLDQCLITRMKSKKDKSGNVIGKEPITDKQGKPMTRRVHSLGELEDYYQVISKQELDQLREYANFGKLVAQKNGRPYEYVKNEADKFKSEFSK